MKTNLDEELGIDGWKKVTSLEGGGLFGINIHDKDIMAGIIAAKIPYLVKKDPEVHDTINSLYVRQEDYNRVIN